MVPQASPRHRSSHHRCGRNQDPPRDLRPRKTRHGRRRRHGHLQKSPPLIFLSETSASSAPLRYFFFPSFFPSFFPAYLFSYLRYASVTYCCTIRCVLKNDPLIAIACCITLKYRDLSL